MTRMLLVTALLALAMPTWAQDALGGDYRPAHASPDSPGKLRLQALGDGWIGTFEGEQRRLEAVPSHELAAMFQGVDVQSTRLRCARSDTLLLCRVEPGTRFPASAFTSTTGYFAVIREAGAFELVRETLPASAPHARP